MTEVVLNEEGTIQVLEEPFGLGRWESSETQMSAHAAASLGFIGAGTINAEVKSLVLLRHLLNYKEVEGELGTERWGVAIRLVILAQSADLEASLTIPQVAARAELNDLQASAILLVHGYEHAGLIDKFPDFAFFKGLNVESYANYTRASDDIKDFIGEHPEGIKPAKLGVQTRPSRNDADMATAVVTTVAIAAVADGKPFDAFRRRHPLYTEDDMNVARGVWERLGEGSFDPGIEPSLVAQARARDALRKADN
ncbi:hypothetical protein [Salinibacterium sp. ZJ450]|uniref:hypothetical protein n=1 Tax=Salinibacterium sp. ZJ450 TaxID=2708338 RepID=UPI00141D9695|nr:hypothetical protein [Salinibacterium sp. ZJ450]